MTTRCLTLHVGAHKTASSLMQHQLDTDRQILSQQGVNLVLRNEMIKNSFFKAVSRLLQGKDVGDDLVMQAREELSTYLAEKNVLMSNEDMLCRLAPGYFFDNVTEVLGFVKEVGGVTPRIVLYIRNQADYLESVFLQMVHLGKDMTFDEFMGMCEPQHYSWLRVARDIEQSVGRDNMHIIPYEAIKRIGATDYYRNLVRLVAKDVSAFKISQKLNYSGHANRSYSAKAMQIANAVAPLLDTDSERWAVRRFLQANFSTANYPRATFLGAERRKSLLALHENENMQLFSQYAPGWDDEQVHYQAASVTELSQAPNPQRSSVGS